MEIKVNDYVRCKNGRIAKIKAIENNFIYFDGEIYRQNGTPMFECETCFSDFIVKHSKNIIDLIEVGDILKLKDGEKWEVQEHQGDGNWIQTEWEVIDNEEDLKSKVDSIVTKEQFSSLEYII